MNKNEFDWDSEEVIVRRQAAIAVYENADGDAVIRAQQDWNDDDDTWIVIEKNNLPRVISALQKLLDGGKNG